MDISQEEVVVAYAEITMLLNLALFALFKALLDFTFAVAVGPLYAYAGFGPDINLFKLTLSYFALVLLMLQQPRQIRRPSDFALLILLVFLVIPVLSIWGLQDKSSTFAFIVIAAFMLLQFLMRLHFILLRIPDVLGGYRIYVVLAWTFVGMLFVALIVRGGLQYLNLDFTKVYAIRSIVTSEFLGGGLAYLWIWGGKSILVVLMTLSLLKRQYYSFAFFTALEILLFALTTHKELLFYPIIVIGVYLASAKRLNLIRVTLLGLCGTLVIAVSLDWMTGNHNFLGVLVFRLFDVIGYNHYAYYQFFQSHPYVMFSNSFLSPFIEYPYSEPVALLIGADRYGVGTDAFANAGFIASGYMQLGAVGVFLYTIILAIILKLFDLLAYGRMPLWVATGVVAVSVFQLVNADLTTSLLTHGIALNLLAVWLIGSRRSSQEIIQSAGNHQCNPLFS